MVGPLSFYDVLLAAIGTSLAGGVLVGALAPVPVTVGVFGGALLATAFVYAALFRYPPRPTPSPRARVAALVWHAFLAGLLLLAVH